MLFILDGISERVAHVWRKRVLFDEYLWILLTAVEHLIQIEIPILLYFILFSHIFTIFSLFNKFRLRDSSFWIRLKRKMCLTKIDYTIGLVPVELLPVLLDSSVAAQYISHQLTSNLKNSFSFNNFIHTHFHRNIK